MKPDLPQLEPATLIEPEAAVEPPPPPKRPVKLIEIIWTMHDEAERIENAQNAMVIAGIQERPHAGQMDRAHVLRSGANVLGELEHYWGDVRKLISDRRQRRSRA